MPVTANNTTHDKNTKIILYDRRFAPENWQASCQFNLAHELKKTQKNVLNGTKKVKNKNQETDGYGRDKRPKTEKLKRKEKR